MAAWTLFRVAALWPTIETPADLIRAVAPPLAAAELPEAVRAAPALPAGRTVRRPFVTLPQEPVPALPKPAEIERDVEAPLQTRVQPEAQVGTPVLPPPLAPIQPARATPSRWSGSAWAIVRPNGGGRDVLGGSQLGGAQAGARIAYALGASRRVALVARVATPLEGPGRELGLGAEVRVAPGVRLVAEQRVALDGGRGGPSLFAVGGVGPVALRGFRLEAYGQAGVVKRQRLEPFADGAARIAHPLLSTGGARFEAGVGAWGGAQRDAARLDLGPSLGAVLPVGGRSVRVTLDWRQRVAGDARPGSGPALSAGMDF